MKRAYKLFLIPIILLSLSYKTKAVCNDDDLNNWANKVSLKVVEYNPTIEFTKTNDIKLILDQVEAAYLLQLTSQRKDVFVRAVSTYSEDELKVKDLYYYGYSILAQGHLKEAIYGVNIYGSEDSACPNELLKTIKYKVPAFNGYLHTEYCEKYPNHENCGSHSDTGDKSNDDFLKEMEDYDKKMNPDAEKDKTIWQVLYEIIREYGFYIVVPFLIVTLIYVIKIENVKQKEKEKENNEKK